MEKNTKGRNQSVTRELNNIAVIDELRLHDASATELSDILHLSNATLSSILQNLEANKIIKVSCNNSANGLGRKRVVYSLNDEFQLGVLVSITNYNIKLVLSDIHRNTLFEDTYEVEEYNLNTMYKIILMIKDILAKKEFRDIPVGNIVISMPGLVNKTTGKLQVSPQFDKDLFENGQSIQKLFNEAFNCDVFLENDTNLMMIGELSTGSFEGHEIGMLVYNDYGLGGALEVNGELFSGSRGYAGEIGLIAIKDDDGQIKALDNVISLRALKERIHNKYQLKLSTKELVSSYKDGNSLIVKEVLDSGHKLGIAIAETMKIIDADCFVIGGRCSIFGDAYLEKILETVRLINKDVVVKYSKCSVDTIIEGAKSISVDMILDKSLQELAK